MSKRGLLSLTAIVVFGVLVSACTGTATPALQPPTDTPVPEVVVEPTEEVKPTEEVVAQAPTEEPTAEPTQEEVATPTEEAVKPELKTGLVATDPADVNLASGRHTLVEFFAFW